MKQGNKKDYRIGADFKTGKEALVKRNESGLSAHISFSYARHRARYLKTGSIGDENAHACEVCGAFLDSLSITTLARRPTWRAAGYVRSFTFCMAVVPSCPFSSSFSSAFFIESICASSTCLSFTNSSIPPVCEIFVF